MFIKISVSIFFLIFGFQTVFGQNSENPKILPLGVLNEKAKVLVFPKFADTEARLSGSVAVQVKIDLPKGEVASARAISGHRLLRPLAEAASKKAKFEPILTEFDAIYGAGVLTFSVEDLTGKVIENKKPKKILSVIDFRTAIINGKAVELEKPDYSDEAKIACAAGKVEVLTLIHSGSGEVFSAKAVSGDELLFEASEKAVMKSKFSPSSINGDNDFYLISKIVYNFDPFAECLKVGVVNKKALSIPKPIVNAAPKDEFTITVQIVVDESGNVIYAKALSGHPLYRAACEKSAKLTKFSPTLINPGPIKIKASLVYKFKPDGAIEF